MSGSAVTWGDYESLAASGGLYAGDGDLYMGDGVSADVDSLNKALTAGADIANPGASPGEGFPLRVESLDQTLFVTQYKATECKFWQMLYKDPAYNTVEEFNRLDAYGSGDAAFIAEGDLPVEDDSLYSRQYTRIKFMGTTRRVTHVMSLLRTAHGDAVARETANGTLWLLRQIEGTLFNGDEDLVPVQFNGLEKLMTTSWADGAANLDDGQSAGYEDDLNVIDLRGQPLTEDHIADMAERLIAEPNYGAPSDLWCPTGVSKDLSKIMYPKERYDLPAPSGGKAGIAIKQIVTPFGDINLNPDIFIPQSKIAAAAGVGRAGIRPSAPTLGAVASPAYGGSGTSYFGSGDAGAYFYQVVAGSRYGKSVPATTGAAVTVAAADEVTIEVQDNGPNTSFYEVYRSTKGGAVGTCKRIFRVKRTGASQTLHDLNRFLPGCDRSYMLTQTSEVLKWKQLAPFSRIPLATVDTSIRWMQVLYGALQLQKALQTGLFLNIGRLPTGANA